MSRRLTIVVPSLSLGGAEGVAAMMANHWAKQGHEVTLITLDSAETDTFTLEAGVQRVALDLMQDSENLFQAISNNRLRINFLQSAIARSQPDAVISLTDRINVLTLLATGKMRCPVLISERSDPRHHPIGRLWSFLRKRTYPRARTLVVQTQGVADFCRQWLKSTHIEVIPNAAPVPRSPEVPAVSAETLAVRTPSKVILGLGRLSHEKGFDLLIEAFAKVAAEFPDWKLQIAGEGPLRDSLQEQINNLGLQNQVELPGWTSEPELQLDQGAIFVLPSRYEGFPNALLQALSRGLACISFDCESGPAEIIRTETDGLLVPAGSVSELAQALKRLLGDEALRHRLANEALQVTERFSVEKYFLQWEQLLDQAISESKT
ncbi:glycosyltransferase family 4 protein [Gimesia algae]|uniref:GalNAc-alpha-(1->4)-GalNAc-alpha-(1->3)-diNAcBac-PP-undecaprenol alpha-1,4-N-acetyl-D-galactosaminyltransferase n=1 Tax=Gimesia algae TaxID=2527971 RepID=A0A517VCY2_9PLAN|nr:glycosyltransferase family 4 protein [Gimesia algae]QDT90862.1 GalNAc-alpha-(1->4)-GalNAc-alpha-(1->3)-diNAcBac-PP-undecaprenol alpha-1,4-N-acetyl-D-galactosaminyltransferase [Gimesia algae]